MKGQLLLKSRVYSGFQIQLLSIDARNFHIHRDTQHSAAMQTVNEVWFDPSGLIPVLSGVVILVPPWIKGPWWTLCYLYEFKLDAMVICCFRDSTFHASTALFIIRTESSCTLWKLLSLKKATEPSDSLSPVFVGTVDWLSVATWLFVWILQARESLWHLPDRHSSRLEIDP